MEALKCPYDGHCEININNRHICSHCRLVKCLNSGMQVEMIQPSFAKRNKPNRKQKSIKDSKQITSTALRRLNEPEQFPTLNLLRSDQSTLTVDQWNLLSNISHCYDAYSGLSIGERFMLEQNNLPFKIRFKQGPIVNFVGMILDKCQSLYTNNQDFLSLSADDRSILLHNLFKHTGSLCANFIGYKIHLFDCPAYFNTLEIITHPDVLPAAKRIAKRLNFDIIIMKLFLAILSFSTTRYTVYLKTSPDNLSNIKQILCIQDIYIEMAWRYLVYRYNFEQAVICFSDLIRGYFAVDEAVVKTQEVQWLTDTISSVVTQTEQTLTLN
ncbi:unnamed protein product [Rotaria sordida]|uniref:Nuclear receptor domain-containing protein n=1 Tax=Rotaria sordida TaxID=392033 RepID=A0A813YBS8_9BILA|nr:unnamed protein product [Rotaria sordida]